jgi:anti-sigma-K factor RskA
VWAAVISGLAAVAASGILVVVMNDNTQLRRLANSLSSRVAQLESQLSQQRVRFAIVTSPQVRVVNLAGQGANSSASGRIFWDQSRRRWLFYAASLPPVPTNKSYQLWFVPKTGNPVSAGVFNTDSRGSAEIDIPVPQSIDQLKAAAVTTEPAGGLPQPSGAFALLGAIE